MATINETLDILNFIEALGVAVAEELKNGLQVWDAVRLFENEEFRKKLSEAIEGINLVPAELVDINVAEGFELSKKALDVADNILKAFTKSAA